MGSSAPTHSLEYFDIESSYLILVNPEMELRGDPTTYASRRGQRLFYSSNNQSGFQAPIAPSISLATDIKVTIPLPNHHSIQK
jgi:hypothetical protein